MHGSKFFENLTFGILISLLAIALFYVKDLRFGVVTADYFPEDAKALNDYNRFRQLFDTDPEHTVGVLVFSHTSIYDSLFFDSLRKKVEAIQANPSVARVRSLFDLRKPHKVLNGYIELPLIHPNTPGRYRQDSLEVGRNRLLTGNFIGSDHKSTFFTVRLQDSISKAAVSAVLQELQATLNSPAFKEHYVIGRPFLENSLSQLMVQELRWLGAVLVLVMILLMGLIFRSLPLVLITLGIIGISMGLAYGIYGFLGFRLEILSNILPVLIILLSINNSLHIYKKYRDEISGQVRGRALALKVIREKFPDVILANLTTALGFGSLYFSVLPAMKNFGLYSAIAICVTLIVNLICFTFLFSRPFFGHLMGRLPWASSRSSHFFSNLHSKLISRHGLRTGMGVTVGLVLIGVFQMDLNTKKLTNLPDADQLKTGILRYGEAFGGVTGFDLMIASHQEGRAYENALFASDTLSKYLQEQGVARIQSIATVQNWIYGEYGSTDLHLGQSGGEKLHLYNGTENVALVRGRMGDIGRIERDALWKRLQPLLTWLAGAYQLDFTITGEEYLNNLAHTYRINEMLLGLALSVVLVSLVILIRFRSWFYFFISFLANILPLLVVAGLMGWFHIELRGSSSLLFTIGYAIAVDDTIHFLTAYRRNRAGETDILKSIGKTLAQVGSPIFFSSLLLSVGFMVLLFSQLWDLFVFGLLIALFVLIAMICDLVILPLLLHYFKRPDHAK